MREHLACEQFRAKLPCRTPNNKTFLSVLHFKTFSDIQYSPGIIHGACTGITTVGQSNIVFYTFLKQTLHGVEYISSTVMSNSLFIPKTEAPKYFLGKCYLCRVKQYFIRLYIQQLQSVMLHKSNCIYQRYCPLSFFTFIIKRCAKKKRLASPLCPKLQPSMKQYHQ